MNGWVRALPIVLLVVVVLYLALVLTADFWWSQLMALFWAVCSQLGACPVSPD